MGRRSAARLRPGPRSTRESIPADRMWEDGLMLCGREYSTAWEVSDANYAATSLENQRSLLLAYEEVIKAAATEVRMKVGLQNMAADTEGLADMVRVPGREDGLDDLRCELNDMNASRAFRGANRIRRARWITLSRPFSSPAEARSQLRRIGADMAGALARMGAQARQLTGPERLAQLCSVLRPSARPETFPDFAQMRRRGVHPRDYAAPDAMEFPHYSPFFRIGDRFGQIIFFRDYPARMDDTLLSDLLDIPAEMLITADYAAMEKDEALRMVNRRKDKVEADIRKRTVTSGKEGNWNAAIPRHLEEEREACERFFDCLNEQDQRLVFGQILIAHFADSREELERSAGAIRSCAAGKGADTGILRERQEAGLATCLPYGPVYAEQYRVLSSENASFFMPFRTREIFEPGGIVYGVNEISGNLVVADRMRRKNGNGFLVGDAGGGKSVLSKYEILSVMLGTEDDLLILDPDGEYGRIVTWLGGQLVRIAPDSPDSINMMDLAADFERSDDPVTLKCGLVSGAVDLMMRGSMTAAQRSVTDRCVYQVLTRAGRDARQPTLLDVYEELAAQKEEAARDTALAMEIYTKGSLSIFARPTSVNVRSRLLCLDIKDIGPQMRDLGMMIVLDEIDRRVAANRKAGRHTWIWCDEIWTLLSYPQTQEYLWGFWKRCRKYGGLPTGITQSLSALKNSEKGREMLSNSEFVFMFGMSAEDRGDAAELFSLSDDQMQYLERAQPGHGLLRAGNVVIPIDATVPADTAFYAAATTKLEDLRGRERPGRTEDRNRIY